MFGIDSWKPEGGLEDLIIIRVVLMHLYPVSGLHTVVVGGCAYINATRYVTPWDARSRFSRFSKSRLLKARSAYP